MIENRPFGSLTKLSQKYLFLTQVPFFRDYYAKGNSLSSLGQVKMKCLAIYSLK